MGGQMEKKKKSLGKKSITSMAVLGIVLFLGIGLAAGTQMYRRDVRIYKDAANSYVYMVCYQVQMIDIDEIIDNEELICAIQAKAEKYIEELDDGKDVYHKLLDEFGEEAMAVYSQWNETDSFIVGLGNICADIRYAYVVIPEEDDLIYIWDSDLPEQSLTVPFARISYSAKEKERIMAVMRGDAESIFFAESIDGELIGTILYPIANEENEIRAVAAIDISISSIRSAFLRLLLNVGAAILLIMLVSITIYHHVVRKQIIDPIVTLTKAADSLVNSLQREDEELFRVNVHTGDEIDVLARSFEEMDAKLIEYIRQNAAITAEKERIGTELSLAARIQADMLPRVFPPFPDRKEIDLYASMSPAKEVGGDFYDFFMIDEDRLVLVMADVSGKGVPAALFMMMSKIMIQNFALTLDGPARVLEKVNDQICLNTSEEMFVTVWLGVLNLKTGLLTAVNAGHEYPVLKMPDGDFELIKDSHGLVIGAMEGSRYKEYEMQLVPGSRLFVYTDGLPEATDAGNRMFGMTRTLKALNEVREGTPREVLDHVTREMVSFVGSEIKFDDTTMLCLDYYGDVSNKEEMKNVGL